MTPISKPDFAKQIRQALLNLHDFASLQKLPLTGLLSTPNGTLDQGVRRLRSEILAAIEQLNPPGGTPNRAKERRPYALLYGRYVQGMTTAELVEELAISVRQFRREHARALNAVTLLLWEKMAGQLDGELEAPLELSSERNEAVQSEAEQLISQAHMDDIAPGELVDGLLTTLAPLAESRHIRLSNRLPDDLPLVRANRVVLRQGLLGLVSYALQRLSWGQIVVEYAGAGDATLLIGAEGEFQTGDPSRVGLDVSRRLIASFGGRVELTDRPDLWTAAVSLPEAEELPILMMDDNAGLIELFRRYLAGRGYRVLEAHGAEQAIDVAARHALRLIILDVMMPDQDGWEVLQRLRGAGPTRDTPIMICSVLDEPELAMTLGASDYLSKPVTQNDLLAKVERWCRAPLLPGGPPKGSPAGNSTPRSG